MEVVSNYFPAEFEENQGNIRIARFSSENWTENLSYRFYSSAVKSTQFIFNNLLFPVPVTVAERSKAWTVFARSDAGIVGSNPTEAWMYV
jgi:hypothetical protein